MEIKNYPVILGYTVLVSILFFSYIVSLYSYLLFHTVAELFSIVIAGLIFIIGWNARETIENSFFMLLSFSSLTIAFLDLLHTLSYRGMGIFPGYDANLPTQLWVAARYLQASSYLFGAIVIKRTCKYKTLISGYIIIGFVLTLMVFLNVFPICYIEPSGLTPFKIISEYVIIFMLMLSIILLNKNRNEFEHDILKLLFFSIIMTISAEIFFTFYISVYGISNFIGHLFKIIAFFLSYKAIIKIGFRDPVDSLYKKLKKSEEKYREAYISANFYKDLFTHDISNIFQIIDGSLELAILEKAKIDENLYQTLEKQMERGKTLISNIQKLSEIENLDLASKPVDLKSTLLKTLNIVKSSFQEKNIDTVIISDQEHIIAQANDLVNEVFVNLLVNAVKYNENDVIEIKIKFSEVKTDGKSYVKISIKDNGIGIPDDKKESIFERGNLSEKGGKGMGFGLSLVRKIITKLDGEIWVEDAVNGNYSKGSNFQLLLPSISNTNSKVENQKNK